MCRGSEKIFHFLPSFETRFQQFVFSFCDQVEVVNLHFSPVGCLEPGLDIPATVYTHHREIGNVKPRLLSVDSWEIVDADVKGFHARPSRRWWGRGQLWSVWCRAGRGRTINSRRVHFSSVLTKTDKCSRYPLEFLKRYIHTFGEFFWSLKSVQ